MSYVVFYLLAVTLFGETVVATRSHDMLCHLMDDTQLKFQIIIVSLIQSKLKSLMKASEIKSLKSTTKSVIIRSFFATTQAAGLKVVLVAFP